jgi:hypothetical protein
MKRLPALLCCLLALACPACVSLPLHSVWAVAEPPRDGQGGAWTQADESLGAGLRVKAMNTDKALYLTLSTDTPSVVAALSGRYGQPVTLWFGQRPEGHGLYITFTPVAEGHESATWNGEPSDSKVRGVALLGPRAERLPRIWIEGSEGLEISQNQSAGILTYTLKLPLQSVALGAFALGASPGDSVDVSVDVEGQDSAALDEPGEVPVEPTESVPGSSNPALSQVPGGGGRHHHGGAGGHASRSVVRPGQPFWYELKVALSRSPLARP